MTKKANTHGNEHGGHAALIDNVARMSRARGERMTDVRRDVLGVLEQLKQPLGAYQILEKLNKGRARKLSAMSLYRTLDFLIDLGVVIKLDSRNAYQLCGVHAHDHSHLLMVCDRCGDMHEVHDEKLSRSLRKLAEANGHHLGHHAVELHGTCDSCG